MKMASPATNDSFIQRTSQTAAVAAMVFTQVITFLLVPVLICYITFWTSYWWICVSYITWYLTIDKDAEINGRRKSDWVTSLSWWYYAKNYYPMKVIKLPWGELDPKRNYFFCYFPHGLSASSTYLTLCSNATEFQTLFPKHKSYMHTISAFYKLPFVRELASTVGGVAASKKSSETISGKEDGGNISGIVIGGAQEAYYSMPGVHKIVLRKRRGFVKIALTQGAPLVPVYSFGENELFTQAVFDDNSMYQKFREFIRKKLGFSIIYPIGRKDSLGMVPKRHPITVVVGEPIDVQKTENPTQEQIDNLHQLFQKKLVESFESQKKYYVKDHETAHLKII